MVGLGEEYGVSASQSLEGTGLKLSDLADERSMVRSAQELRVIDNLVTALPNAHGLGLRAGKRYQLTTFGIWAFAIISSPNLRAAFEVAARFTDLSFVLIHFSLVEDDTNAKIMMDVDHIQEHLRQFVIERHLAVLLTLTREMMGEACVQPHEIRLTLGEFPAAHLSEFLDPKRIHLDAETNCVIYDKAALEVASPKANAATAEFCIQQCEELLNKRVAQSGFSGEVRGLLLRRIANVPTLEAGASHFNMSPRTFRRRLEQEGNSYRTLVEQTREGVAIELLGTAKLSVESVAERLGYAETSSFIHAFKRWTGQTPAKYRKRG